MRDQNSADSFLENNPYAEYGPYDIDFTSAERSRPPPMPYDDPYADDYQLPMESSDRASTSHGDSRQAGDESSDLEHRHDFQRRDHPPLESIRGRFRERDDGY